jgi:hypothetical protein
VVNTIFLVLATLLVGAVPIVYVFRANLRDPLARAILASTGATAFAFTATCASVVVYHAGFDPPVWVWNWIARLTYAAVASGEFLFLIALLRIIRGRDPL